MLDTPQLQSSPPIYSKVSSWLLLLPLLFFFSNGSFSFTTRSTDAISAQNAHLSQTAEGIRPLVIVFYLFMLILFFVGHRVTWRGFSNNPLIIAALAWCALTATWSASPVLSLRASIELGMSTFFAIYLYEAFPTEKLMDLWIFVGTIAAVTCLAFVFFLPQYGVTQISGLGEWRGITNHKNAMGVNMTYMLTPVLFARVRPWFRVLYSCLVIFLAVMSKSREAWFVCIAALTFLAWMPLYRRFREKERLVLVAGTAIVLVAAVTLVLVNFDALMIGIGKDPTMTGRTDIYAATFDSLKKRPLLGYGFEAFWIPQNGESITVALTIHWMAIGYAENGILETALQVGCIGIFLAFLMVGKGVRQGIRLIRSGLYNPRVGWFLMLLFLELITNIEAGAVLTPSNLPWMMTIIACVGLADEARRVRAAQQIYLPEATGLEPMPAR
jgi:exopolysaccharide production protein ExoQ